MSILRSFAHLLHDSLALICYLFAALFFAMAQGLDLDGEA